MKRQNIKYLIISILILSIVFVSSGCDKYTNDVTSNKIYISEISDEYIITLFDKAAETAASGGMFERSSDGIFRERKTNETISQFVDRFTIIFTDRYTTNYFDLYGYSQELTDGTWILNLSTPAAQLSTYDQGSSFVHFDDIADNTRYDGYDKVVIGGYGDRGSDLSLISNKVNVLSRSDNEIIVANTIWHCSPHLDSEPEYVCHLENGRVIIDGSFNGFDEAGNVSILDTSKSGIILTPQEQVKNNYYLKVTYKYRLIFENGNWKFDNFILWG